MLVFAALSLFLVGGNLRADFNGSLFIIKFLGVIATTIFVYSLNDVLDEERSIVEHFKSLRLGGLLLPLSAIGTYLYIEQNSAFWLLFLIFSVGVIYSLELPAIARFHRFKNLFVLKNIFISFGWGILVLFGFGSIDQNTVVNIALFSALQVFIGSVMRDISDCDSDRDHGVRTLPVVYGELKTYKILHVMNLLSWALLLAFHYFENSLHHFYLSLILVCLWRGFILYKASQQSSLKDRYLQTYNLFTCFIILLVVSGALWI